MADQVFFFSGADIRALLSMKICIEAMKTAFTSLSNKEAVMPVRMRMEMEADNANALFMPVYIPSINRMGVKTVTNSANNPAKGLPMVHAMMTVFDTTTGAPLAILDGESITALRTGAVSGLATSLLAREDASVAAVIGTGAQGETQLEAVCNVRQIQKAYVFDLNKERAEYFAEKMSSKLTIDVMPAESKDILSEADIICTATPSRTPVFSDEYLKSGVHINGVGSYKPDMIEIPHETVKKAKIVVDQKDGCLAEAGDLLQPIEKGIIHRDDIHGELGDVVTGKISSRESQIETTFFKSVGLAVQDLVCADLVIKTAQENNVGTSLTL